MPLKDAGADDIISLSIKKIYRYMIHMKMTLVKIYPAISPDVPKIFRSVLLYYYN